jgi:hypothetical protein
MRATLLLILVVAVAGCGEPERPVSETANEPTTLTKGANVPWDRDSIAGCDLVMEGELREVIGRIVEMEEGDGDWYGCRWVTASGVVELLVFPDTDLPEEACQEKQASVPHGQTVEGDRREVPDLGESAVWGSQGDLLVCTERGLLAVHLRQMDADPNAAQAAAVEIAAIALTRL